MDERHHIIALLSQAEGVGDFEIEIKHYLLGEIFQIFHRDPQLLPEFFSRFLNFAADSHPRIRSLVISSAAEICKDMPVSLETISLCK
jgi:hypothetical protein